MRETVTDEKTPQTCHTLLFSDDEEYEDEDEEEEDKEKDDGWQIALICRGCSFKSIAVTNGT